MAEVAVIMTGDEAKLWRAQQKILAQTRELEGSYKKVGAAGKKAGDEGETAAKRAGQGHRDLASSIGSSIKQYIGLQAAIQLATEALTYYNEENQKSKSDVERLEGSKRELRQMATGAVDLQRMQDAADQLARAEGIDRVTALDIMSKAKAGGFEDFADELAKLAPVIEPETAGRMVGKLKGIFPKLTPEQGINAALAASNSAFANVEELSRAAPVSAGGVAQAGGTAAELFALNSVLADVAKSADVAADRINAIGMKIGLNAELGGGGVIAGIEKLQAMPEEKRREFLKEDIETNQAYLWITENLPKIQGLLQQVQTGMDVTGVPESAMRRKIEALYDQSTEQGRINVAMRERNQQRAELELQTEKQAPEAFGREGALAGRLAELKMAKADAMAQFAAYSVGRAMEMIGASPETVAGAAGVAAEVFSGEQAGALGKRVGAIHRARQQQSVESRTPAPQPEERVTIRRGSTWMAIPASQVQSTDERLSPSQPATPRQTDQSSLELRSAANQLSVAARALTDAARLQAQQPQSFARQQRRQAEVPA